MFTDKEADILKALVEEEVTYLLDNEDGYDPLLAEYYSTLMRILLKLKLDDKNLSDRELEGLIGDRFLERLLV
jgi:hypothetical protein